MRPRQPQDQNWVTTGPAAEALGVHPNTLGRWYREGLVTPAATTARGQTRWNIPDLQRQINALNARRARAAHAKKNDQQDEESPPGDVAMAAVG
jgi:predicted site-specific integrase-resolvase